MIELWKLYKSGTWIEPFLILSIVLFISGSLFLYILITRSRYNNINKERLTIKYSQIIETLVFRKIFQDCSLLTIRRDKNYIKLIKSNFFREIFIEIIIDLHKNYEGVYAQKLEQFYRESGLINDSYKKLKNRNWEIKCKGISELSEMNVLKAFESIIKASKSKNKTLQITAISAAIRLECSKGIVKITEHPYPIDEWSQLNIINAFKKHDIEETECIEVLLESQNTTIIELGLKLIKEFNLTGKSKYVAYLASQTTNMHLKSEAQNLLYELQFNSIGR
ncbi:MAG: hypothetical protein V4548_06030 [Bacteroidota bacterium]